MRNPMPPGTSAAAAASATPESPCRSSLPRNQKAREAWEAHRHRQLVQREKEEREHREREESRQREKIVREGGNESIARRELVSSVNETAEIATTNLSLGSASVTKDTRATTSATALIATNTPFSLSFSRENVNNTLGVINKDNGPFTTSIVTDDHKHNKTKRVSSIYNERSRFFIFKCV